MKIGTITIENTAGLAPMASVGDEAYRLMCKRYGAGFVVGEMASAKGLFYSERATGALLTTTREEYPMGVQLFGSDVATMAAACKQAAAYHPQWIDINMGCPVVKVVKTGGGSALLRTPKLAVEIAQACVEAVAAANIPVTVKMRSGFDEEHKNAAELAVALENVGVRALTVHGRTREQMYAPPVDLESIAAVKRAVKIPVIGNGDIFTPAQAKEMLEKTGCDLIMVGRGSYGRPWIFEEIATYLKSGELVAEKSLDEKLEIMCEHVSLACKKKGEKVAMRESRKLVGWYLKGLKDATKWRLLACMLERYEDLQSLIKQLRNHAH